MFNQQYMDPTVMSRTDLKTGFCQPLHNSVGMECKFLKSFCSVMHQGDSIFVQ